MGGLFGVMAGSGYRLLAHVYSLQNSYPIYSERSKNAPFPEEPPLPPEGKAFVTIGWATGIAAGLLAAHLWCRLMFQIGRRNGYSQLALHGAWTGLVAGIMATLILHSVLWIASIKVAPGPLIIGLICALISGPIAGVVCGAAFKWTIRPISTAGRESETIAA